MGQERGRPKRAGETPRETFHRRWPELASRFSDDDLLECLRRLQKEHGYVTAQIIRDDELSPTPQLFTTRFGSLLNAYESAGLERSEEHTSELQSLMRISYAVFCLKKQKTDKNTSIQLQH